MPNNEAASPDDVGDDKKSEVSNDSVSFEDEDKVDNAHKGDGIIDDMILLGLQKLKQQKKEKLCIIYPNWTSKTVWDIFISVILLFSCFSTPLDLAFPLNMILEKYPRWYIILT